MTELARYKKAMEFVIAELRALGLDYAHFTAAVKERVERILNPPPAEETVEVSAGWVNVYPPDDGSSTHSLSGSYQTRESADDCAGSHRVGCQEIRVKITRPPPRPVERSGSGSIVGRSGLVPTVHVVIPEGDVPPMGAHVTLAWTETPKGE